MVHTRILAKLSPPSPVCIYNFFTCPASQLFHVPCKLTAIIGRPSSSFMLLYVHRSHQKDGEPRTATSTFTQFLTSEWLAICFNVVLRPQKP